MTKLSDIRGFTAAGGGGGGGGGGSDEWPAQSDYKVFSSTGWNSSSTYDFQMRAAGGMKNNKFVALRGENNSSINTVRLRVIPFQVNTTTGAISTLGSETNSWSNSSYTGWSTTHWTSPEGTGAFFYGGNIGFPGHSTYKFGYGYGYVNSSGALSNSSYSVTNADHAYNQWDQSVPTGGKNGTSGYIVSTGYNQDAGNMAYWRKSYFNGSSWSVGGNNNPSSNTSTCYGSCMIANPSATVTGNQLVDICNYQNSSGIGQFRVVSANGNNYEHNMGVTGLDSQILGFQMDDGSVITYSSKFGTQKFTNYSTKTTLSYGWPYGYTAQTSGFGLGNNRFVIGMNSSSWVANNENILLMEINPSTGELTTLEWGPTSNTKSGFYPLRSSYCRGWPVWASDSDTTPTHICFIRCRGEATTQVATFPWPFTYDLSS